jgi:hypothetical protein
MTKNFKMIKFLLFIIIFLPACVSNTNEFPDKDAQIWTGKISGMATGDMTMKSWEINNSTGEHKVRSKISLDITQTSDGHTGTVQGTLTGSIKNGKFKGKFMGHAMVVQGDSHVSGSFIGNFSEKNGSGSWSLSADRNIVKYTGQWTLKKQ